MEIAPPGTTSRRLAADDPGDRGRWIRWVARELRRAGTPCVVLDNLVRGHRELVSDADLIVGDIGDAVLVRRTIREYGVTAVMHFAAYAYVGESVADPLTYYENNVTATVRLLRAIVDTDVRMLVFSSTCATYGHPESTPITEAHPQRPINPYGATKLMVERILEDMSRAHGVRAVVLRYFNAAGADPSGAIGELHVPETHLIPLTLQAATGQRDGVEIYRKRREGAANSRMDAEVRHPRRHHRYGLELAQQSRELRSSVTPIPSTSRFLLSIRP